MNLKTLLKCISCTFTLLVASELYSQNLLDTSTWTIGTGSVSGFAVNGSASENIRELGEDHIGNQIVLWKAVPDASPGSDGGWTTPYTSIDNTKTYRLTVWIKKTNSNSGATFFGTNSFAAGAYHITTLSNSNQTNPYFLAGSLPELDKWYLLVGYVHHKNYTSNVHQGKIYDGVTGQVVQSLTDFKFKNTATTILHRTYLNYDTNIQDRQYFCKPRIDIVNNSEPSINELLSINPNSKLIFAYDNAGNQKQRFYCSEPGCPIPNPPAGRAVPEDTIASIEVEDKLEEGSSILETELTLYPNPTSGLVSLRFNSNSDITLANDISVYNGAGILVKTIPNNSKSQIEIDFTNLASGMYLVHVHLSNGTSISKQIIKN